MVFWQLFYIACYSQLNFKIMAMFGKNWIEDSKDDFEPINAMTHWKDDEDKKDVSMFSKWKDEEKTEDDNYKMSKTESF